jgi:hypothetical protein
MEYNIYGMMLEYNRLNNIRHNLYKKRSARVRKTFEKLKIAKNSLQSLYNVENRLDLYKVAMVRSWTKKDEKELIKARNTLKKFGKKFSKELRKYGLVAIRYPGGNKIKGLKLKQ